MSPNKPLNFLMFSQVLLIPGKRKFKLKEILLYLYTLISEKNFRCASQRFSTKRTAVHAGRLLLLACLEIDYAHKVKVEFKSNYLLKIS